METKKEKIKGILFRYIIPTTLVILVAVCLFLIDKKLLAPVLTPIVALAAFLSQQYQIQLQKESDSFNR